MQSKSSGQLKTSSSLVFLFTDHRPLTTEFMLTLFDKLWEEHVVYEQAGAPALLYIDLHLVHEVTSPQAFDGLRVAARRVRRPDLTVATADHNVPTTAR